MTLIWGRITSINVRKVIWALQELGMPFERKDAGAAFGVVNTDEYAQLNPNRLGRGSRRRSCASSAVTGRINVNSNVWLITVNL